MLQDLSYLTQDYIFYFHTFCSKFHVVSFLSTNLFIFIYIQTTGSHPSSPPAPSLHFHLILSTPYLSLRSPMGINQAQAGTNCIPLHQD